MTVCLVGGEDEFSSGGSNNPTLQEMNPNHGYSQGFYSQPGANFGPGAQGGHGYPSSMSPYPGAHSGPMSPYSQNQGQSPNSGQSMYQNQNSQYGNQGQSSPYPGAGGYPPPPPSSSSSHPQGQFHPHQSMQFYNNQSPTHNVQHHYSFGAGGGHLRHPSPDHGPRGGPGGPGGPHPMGMMMPGTRIPHPMNSPNQNMTGNQIKTESVDLKVGGTYAAIPQGYSQSGFGFNGYGSSGVQPRPILSPMSPHGRLNISPGAGGAPNQSPGDAPNLSPHSGHPGSNNIYSGSQPSPGNNTISNISSQTSNFPSQPPFGYDYYSKQNPHMQPSPLSQTGGYGGPKDESAGGGYTADDKLSDVQSNASAQSGGGSTPKHSEEHGLVNIKKETTSEQSGETNPGENGDNKGGGGREEGDDGTSKIKTETLEGFNYEEAPGSKGYPAPGNQALLENMNLDSIPELPDIPELKYEDMMDRRHMPGKQADVPKQPQSPPSGEEGGMGNHGMEYMDENKEEGYTDAMSWHMQGLEPGYPPPHHLQYPNQQQMWANFYNPGGAPSEEHNGGRYPGPMSPHMGLEGWWQGGPHPGPDMGPYRMGSPGLGPAPGPWAMRGPRPRGERRGPGRPRLTSKGERGARTRNPSTPGASPYYGGPDGLPPDMLGSPSEMKRGPGRPKAMLDPNAPKVPGETTKNGNKKRYTCEVCQKRFSTAWYVRVHRRSHNGERPYVCNNCGKGFMLPNVLQVHLRKCEKNNPPAGGSVGGTGPQGPIAATPRAKDLAPNNSPSQTSSPNLSGPPNFGFPDPGAAQTHQFPGMGSFNQRYMGGMTPPHMSGQPAYNPGLGPDVPLSQSYGSEHQSHGYGIPEHPRLDHSPHHQFSPNYSPGSSLPPSSEADHHFLAIDKPLDKGGTESNHSGSDPPNYCMTCDLSFEDKTVTEEHLKQHRPFSCEICEKRFSQKCNLVTHIRLHTGEKPYNCDFCDKRFTQKGNLDAHIKTHTKEKPFQCTLCPKRFAFKSSMQTHLKNHQNGTLGLDVDEDDIETIKLHARMQHMDRADFEMDYHSEEFDSNPATSPSISPPAEYGGEAIIHNRISNTVEADISKFPDSRQTLAMLQ